MTPEDIGDIFQELEDALFAMAIRNMDAHKAWEDAEGFMWTQWQAEQIKGLRTYREKVNKITNIGFAKANKAITEFLQEAYDGSVDDAVGFAVKAGKGYIRPEFFGVNSDKMDILLEEAIKDIDAKRYACINKMNSGYTDFLRKADIFAQSGSMTIPQALDYAMKDFLSAGLNCVEYSNGNRVNIASYAEMALRTSSSEVTRQANGDVRDELDEHLVVSNVIGMTCPYCQKWQGQVLIDDVYSDGKPDGKHKLVSQAKADHFLHPNCRHQLFMYIEGVTEVADLPDSKETKERYKAEQKQRYQERQIRKYKRLRDGAVDPADRQKYDARVKEWTEKHDEYLKEHPYLRKNPKRLAASYDDPRIKQKYEDVTKTWCDTVPQGETKVYEGKTSIDIEGRIFDESNAKLEIDHKPYERNVAQVLANRMNSEIELVPRVNEPQGIPTPDFRIFRTGQTMELKTIKLPQEEGKAVPWDAIFRSTKKARKQSSFVIVDISLYPYSNQLISEQVNMVFKHFNTSFVENLMIIKNGEIQKVYRRKR